MSDTEKRVFKLAGTVGFDTASQGKTAALLKAMAKGVDLICEDLDFLKKQIYPLTSQGDALALNCDMLGISADSEKEKTALVKEGLKRQFGDYKISDFSSSFTQLGYDADVSVYNTVYIRNGSGPVSKSENLSLLAESLKNYLVPCCTVTFCGSGIDFDGWDSMPYSFNELDGWGFCFNILETFDE